MVRGGGSGPVYRNTPLGPQIHLHFRGKDSPAKSLVSLSLPNYRPSSCISTSGVTMGKELQRQEEKGRGRVASVVRTWCDEQAQGGMSTAEFRILKGLKTAQWAESRQEVQFDPNIWLFSEHW